MLVHFESNHQGSWVYMYREFLFSQLGVWEHISFPIWGETLAAEVFDFFY